MIDGLIAGRVFGQPAQRTGKSGKPFVVAKLRAAVDGAEAVFVNVLAFADAAQAALLALADGDSVAVTGPLKVGVWQDKTGAHRPSIDLVAHQVLTAYAVTKKRTAMHQSAPAPAHGRRRDEAWIAASPHDRHAQGDMDPLDF